VTDTVIYDAQPPQRPLPYPVSFDVEGPAEVSRLSTFFRIILLLPVLIFVGIIIIAVTGGLWGGLILAHWITVLVRGRPVGWICRAIVAIQRFALRAFTYFFLITDKYPPFEGDWSASFEVDQTERIQRKQLVIWKTLASIPHVFALVVLWFAVIVCIVISWFAILFTGRFPLGLRGFIVGWMRWGARVGAYWMSLRDEYPPFSLSADASPASSTAHVLSGIGGFGLVAVAAAGAIVAVILVPVREETQISYAELLAGEPSETLGGLDFRITLLGAVDPYELSAEFIPREGNRFVSFSAPIFNNREFDYLLEVSDFQLKDLNGKGYDAEIVSVGGSLAPADLLEKTIAAVQVIFEIPEDAAPAEFKFKPEFLFSATFEFTE